MIDKNKTWYKISEGSWNRKLPASRWVQEIFKYIIFPEDAFKYIPRNYSKFFEPIEFELPKIKSQPKPKPKPKPKPVKTSNPETLDKSKDIKITKAVLKAKSLISKKKFEEALESLLTFKAQELIENKEIDRLIEQLEKRLDNPIREQL